MTQEPRAEGGEEAARPSAADALSEVEPRPARLDIGEDGGAGLRDPAAEAYDAFVWKNLRRNYAAHFLHGMFGMTGFRLVNAPTFVPAYLHTMSGSDIVVGLALGLQQLGGVISPIIGAVHIEHRKRIVPVSMVLGTLMRIQLLGLALAGFLLGGLPLLVATILFLFLLGVFGGPQRVAFQVLLGKLIPIHLRGRLQAWRNLVGGAIAALLAYFAGRYLVEANVWGNGYATTFLLAFGLTSVGLFAIQVLCREPEPPSVRAASRVRDRVREFPALLAADRNFRAFLIAQVFAVSGRVAAPFYIVYATDKIGMSGTNLGLLTLAYLGADTVMNLVWGYMADRSGFRSTFVAALAFWIGATALLMSTSSLTWMLVAFFGLGAAQSGYFMSSSNIVLEFGDFQDVAMRLALSASAEGVMAAAGPLLGGLIAATLGYYAVFGTSMAFLLVALVLLVVHVKEPRKSGERRGRRKARA